MPSDSPLYDLMLLLSTSTDDARRKQILDEVDSAISTAGGSVERNDDWGARTLTFNIAHQADADYHLLQFTGPTSLLESLSHSLRIADDVLRFRIIKVTPGTPPAPDTPPPVVAGVAGASRTGASATGTATADTEATSTEAAAPGSGADAPRADTANGESAGEGAPVGEAESEASAGTVQDEGGGDGGDTAQGDQPPG